MNASIASAVASGRQLFRWFRRLGRRVPAVLIAASFIPGLVVAAEPADKACQKDELKTDAGCWKSARLLNKVNPVYPSEAKKRRVEGSITLKGRITEQGTVDEIEVEKAQATDESYISSFRDAATDAIGKRRYSPATMDGKPMPTYFTETLDFVLRH